MVSELAREPPSIRRDGFGARTIEQTEKHGRCERLQLSPVLATPVSEQAIRARAAHLTSWDQVRSDVSRVWSEKAQRCQS
jgi:hypothetical protein